MQLTIRKLGDGFNRVRVSDGEVDKFNVRLCACGVVLRDGLKSGYYVAISSGKEDCGQWSISTAKQFTNSLH